MLNRPQIQRVCFPEDQSGRITRRRLQTLVDEKLINRLRVLVHHPHFGSPGPVYFPSQKGCEFLAEHYEDERFLAGCTQPPQAHHVLHWLAVSETHIALDSAIARQNQVQLTAWFNEWDVVNPEESAPERRFRLYTLLRESPRLICAPDAAFMLAVGEHRKAFYLEQDRNTSGVRQVAASKTPGYAALAERQLHRRHFPEYDARHVQRAGDRADSAASRRIAQVASRQTRRTALETRGGYGSFSREVSVRASLLPS